MRPIERPRWRVAFAGLALLAYLAACVPAKTTTPDLNATGQAVVVTGDYYDAGLFRARYPDGWRVITSPAGEPPFVTFVAPDNCALIVLSVEPRVVPPLGADCAPGGAVREFDAVAGDAVPVYAAGRAQAGDSAFARVWETVLTSIITG